MTDRMHVRSYMYYLR